MWAISTTNWNFPYFSVVWFGIQHLSLCEIDGRKALEISICCTRNYCSYLDLPLVLDRLEPSVWSVEGSSINKLQLIVEAGSWVQYSSGHSLIWPSFGNLIRSGRHIGLSVGLKMYRTWIASPYPRWCPPTQYSKTAK